MNNLSSSDLFSKDMKRIPLDVLPRLLFLSIYVGAHATNRMVKMTENCSSGVIGCKKNKMLDRM
jgi:hypothetical protein